MSDKIKNNPLVAIGVPVYNGGKFLDECLRSILKQTYKNWECIIVNNCSTDDTLDISKGFVNEDKRFRLIDNEEFLNVMQNWNQASIHVSPEAEYFKIVPADDWVTPDYLEEMLKVMEDHSNVGICSSYRIDGASARGEGVDIYKGPVYPGKDIFEKEITIKIDVTGSANAYLCKTKFLKKLPGYPKIFNENNLHVDMELAYDLLNISDFGYVFKILSYTRRHSESFTDSMTYQLNTHWNSREIILFKYKSNSLELQQTYKDLRLKYAYFLLTRKILRDKKCLEWHGKFLSRKFSFGEYFIGTLTRNRITLGLQAVLKKLQSIFK